MRPACRGGSTQVDAARTLLETMMTMTEWKDDIFRS
jgi:hypothetical protein